MYSVHHIELNLVRRLENVGSDGKSIFINFLIKNTNCTLYIYIHIPYICMGMHGAKYAQIDKCAKVHIHLSYYLSSIIFRCRENQKRFLSILNPMQRQIASD